MGEKSNNYASARENDQNKDVIKLIEKSLTTWSDQGINISVDEAKEILVKYEKIKKDQIFAISSKELSRLASGLGADKNISLYKLIWKLKDRANEKPEIILPLPPIQNIDVTADIDTSTTVNENLTPYVNGLIIENARIIPPPNALNLLADLNNTWNVDNESRDFVSEQHLKRSLSHASNWGANINTVYTRITGTSPDWTKTEETVNKFHEALRMNIILIRQVTGNGNAGLDMLLRGKIPEFIQAVQKKVVENWGKPLEVKMDNTQGISPVVYNTLGATGTIAVALATSGLIIIWTEKHNVDADKFIEDFKADKNGGVLHTTGSVLNWVKEAFMGRKLSLPLGRERVADFTKKVSQYTEQVMTLSKDTTPETFDISIKDLEAKKALKEQETINNQETTNLEDINNIQTRKALKKKELQKIQEDIKVQEDIKKHFIIIQDTAKNTGITLTIEDIQKILIQSYIINKWTENEGSNWSASVGLLMLLGVHRDSLSIDRGKTEVSELNKIEKDLTKKELTTESYTESGVKIEHINRKWVYTIPSKITMEYDDKPYPVVSSLTLDEDSYYIYISDTPQELLFSHDGEKYTLTLTPSANQKSSIKIEKQKIKEKNELARDSASLDRELFMIGHIRDVRGGNTISETNAQKFDTLVTLLAKQDFDWVEKLLIEMSKKGRYRGLAKKLLANKWEDNKNMATWTSYMYGSAASRAKQDFTQDYADTKVRTSATRRAEQRLADKNGIRLSPDGDSKFRITSGEKFTPRQASEMYPGQEMTIACFATPSYMGADGKHYTWNHRLDTYEGSVFIMNHTELITDTQEKDSIIRGIMKQNAEKNGVLTHCNALNDFIKENGGTTLISIDTYIDYLSGKITDLWIPGLVVQSGKEPKVFEGRAMIAGNVCLNRLYGITYPAFGSQKVAPVVAIDTSVPLNIVWVTTNVSALGATPLLVTKKWTSSAWSASTASNPGSGTGGGGNAGGGI